MLNLYKTFKNREIINNLCFVECIRFEFGSVHIFVDPDPKHFTYNPLKVNFAPTSSESYIVEFFSRKMCLGKY